MARSATRWTDQKGAPQVMFLAALVLGIVGVVGLKVFAAPAILVILFPVVVLSSYAALVWLPGLRLRPDQTGDNVYYLGFLFTLVSLAYTLNKFSVSAGVEEVVQNFGVAISSTIAGVALRVMLSQMRTDPYDTERATRLALVDSSRHLRDELDASTLEFNAFRRQTQQSVGDGMRELRDIASDQLKSSTGELERTLKAATGRIEAVLNTWADGADTFNLQSKALVDAMRGLSTRLEEVRPPSGIIESKLAGAGDSISKFTDVADIAMSRLSQAASNMEDGASEISGIVGSATQLVSAAREQNMVLSRAGEVFEATQSQLGFVREDAQAFHLAFQKVSTDLTASLSGFVERLEGALTEAKRQSDTRDQDTLAHIDARLQTMGDRIFADRAATAELTPPPEHRL